MTVTNRPPTRRDIAEAALVAHRARAPKLPLTFLGTGGKPAGEQGWQPHMWAHQLFASGVVFATAQALDQAVENGLIDSPLPFGGAGLVVAAGSLSVGVATAAAGLLATAGEKFTDWARAYFTGGPLAAGAYIAAVANTSPYSTGALAALAGGTAIGMGMYWRMRAEQDEHEAKIVARWAYPSTAGQATTAPPVAPAPAPGLLDDVDPEKRKWNAAFDRTGLKGCKMLKRIDTPAGYAVLVGLPRTGAVGGDQVAAKLPNLERALGMLKDCLEYDVSVTREGRELSDRCWIHVDVANILEQLLAMPDDLEDHQPRSVNHFLRIGTFVDGAPMLLRFREISALIVGVRGRGKTNLFHVLVHRLSQCVDVLLWAIDLKGGRAVKPWLAAWLDEAADRPVFDWVATTRAEASLMIHAGEALIGYRGQKSAGGSKITPSVHQPAVLVLCDEIAALVGKHSGPKMPVKGRDWWRNPTANQIAGVLTSCIQLGRSEAVDFILFTQRATVSMVGGGDLKAQCELRIGLGVTNQGDATSVFQNDHVNARKLSRLKNKKTRGACLIENGEDPNHLCGKTYFYDDDQAMLDRIYRTATLHAGYPADLPIGEQQAIDDALMALTSGECGYGVGPDAANDQRWSLERAAHLYAEDLDPEWEDDEPSDGEHLGGLDPVSGAGRGGRAGAAVRPRSAPPATRRPAAGTAVTADGTVTLGDLENIARQAQGLPPLPGRPGPHPPTYQRGAVPTSPGHDPVQPDPPTTGNKYYVPRDQRAPGQPATEPDLSDRDPNVDRYQREFDDLVKYLAKADTAAEPVYDTSDPEQSTRYDVMLEIVKETGTTGIMAGGIMAKMVTTGRAWSNRQDLHPALKRAKEAGHIVQPLERGRYYWPAYAPGRPA